jgi:hypothetical protein
MPIKLPKFGKFIDALREAGVETGSARGFWGGVTKDDDIVVTAWLDQRRADDSFPIWRPRTRHGGLLDMWEMGRIAPNATVRLIIVRRKAKEDPNERSSIHSAGLMPGRWRVREFGEGRATAIVEQA